MAISELIKLLENHASTKYEDAKINKVLVLDESYGMGCAQKCWIGNGQLSKKKKK